MNMNEIIQSMEARMTRIETNLDKLANNHLAHIEKYTRWTLIGILISVGVSLTALAITVL